MLLVDQQRARVRYPGPTQIVLATLPAVTDELPGAGAFVTDISGVVCFTAGYV